jgi:hypothetical protein
MDTHAPEDTKRPLPEDKGELSRGEVTRLLLDWNNGEAAARDRLVTLVYGELRRMAQRKARIYLRNELTRTKGASDGSRAMERD